MTFKSPTRPYCRCCGAPIPKETHSHWFGQISPSNTDYSTNHPEEPHTLEEAQRLLNQQLVSVRYWGRDDKRIVHYATSWDGESYRDEFFHSQECAAAFGRMAAREHPELVTQQAADAAKLRGLT